MSTDAESLYQAAMRLPEDERMYLAGRLLESVDPDAAPDWEAAWGEEIARRIEEMDSGKAKEPRKNNLSKLLVLKIGI